MHAIVALNMTNMIAIGHMHGLYFLQVSINNIVAINLRVMRVHAEIVTHLLIIILIHADVGLYDDK